MKYKRKISDLISAIIPISISYSQLFAACQQCSEMTTHLAAQLHKLPNEDRCIQQFEAVLSWSRNLIHRSIQITAMDYLVMDNALLNSVRKCTIYNGIIQTSAFIQHR